MSMPAETPDEVKNFPSSTHRAWAIQLTRGPWEATHAKARLFEWRSSRRGRPPSRGARSPCRRWRQSARSSHWRPARRGTRAFATSRRVPMPPGTSSTSEAAGVGQRGVGDGRGPLGLATAPGRSASMVIARPRSRPQQRRTSRAGRRRPGARNPGRGRRPRLNGAGASLTGGRGLAGPAHFPGETFALDTAFSIASKSAPFSSSLEQDDSRRHLVVEADHAARDHLELVLLRRLAHARGVREDAVGAVSRRHGRIREAPFSSRPRPRQTGRPMARTFSWISSLEVGSPLWREDEVEHAPGVHVAPGGARTMAIAGVLLLRRGIGPALGRARSRRSRGPRGPGSRRARGRGRRSRARSRMVSFHLGAFRPGRAAQFHRWNNRSAGAGGKMCVCGGRIPSPPPVGLPCGANRLGGSPARAQGPQAERVVALRETRCRRVGHERAVVEPGGLEPQRAVDQQLAEGRADQVLAADDLGDPHRRVVHGAGELVARAVVLAPHREVPEVPARHARAAARGGRPRTRAPRRRARAGAS